MAEQPAGIGNEVRQVAPALGAEQIDAEIREMTLEDVELAVHHLQQQVRLAGQANEPPADGEPDDRQEHEHDDREARTARQRHDAGQAARAGIEKRREQNAGEQQKQAGRVVPHEHQRRGDAQREQRRGPRTGPRRRPWVADRRRGSQLCLHRT